jgi:hypothetical protein
MELGPGESIGKGSSAGKERRCSVRAARNIYVLIRSRSRIGVSFSLVERYREDMEIS